jgi:membrane-bound lytic murein transglycosylase A
MPRRAVILIWFLILVIVALAAALFVVVRAQRRHPTLLRSGPETAVPEPPRLELEPATFASLPGWDEDGLSGALDAFVASCSAFERQPPDRAVGPGGVGGTVADWLGPCRAARQLAPDDPEALRGFLSASFRPWVVTNRGDSLGLFTGYYEPSLHGSRRRHGAFQTPLYAEPSDLVQVDLGAFRQSLAGVRIAGRLRGRRLEPYYDRSQIQAGALSDRGLELYWVDDPVDAFFLEIQGSGRLVLENGSVVRLGFAGQNGHPYEAIGRVLVKRGALAPEAVSMQSIRAWLESHPEQAPEVMARNASYVFFRKLRGPGPVGSQGVPLTPGRSLAVDTAFLPLGAPVWLATWAPAPASSPEAGVAPDPAPAASGNRRAGSRPAVRRVRRLVMAQDTGGAIRGPVRGDVFWGPGDEAADVAGRMRSGGRMWLLLPRHLDPPGARGPASGAVP